jgi:hypothetical protein
MLLLVSVQEGMDKGFTEEDIQRAFAKPGIWYIAPDQILCRISKPIPESPPRLTS